MCGRISRRNRLTKSPSRKNAMCIITFPRFFCSPETPSPPGPRVPMRMIKSYSQRDISLSYNLTDTQFFDLRSHLLKSKIDRGTLPKLCPPSQFFPKKP